MKLLFVIPHFCASAVSAQRHGSLCGNSAERALALRRCIMALHQTLGASQGMILVGSRQTISANQPLCHQVHICVITTQRDHALEALELPSNAYEHVVGDVDVEPLHLGFACHRLMRERMKDFDYCGYLEDDLILHDAWFIEKLRWFSRHVGNDCLLMPNRYEVACDLAYKKCYLDGDLKPHVCQPFQDITSGSRLSSTFLGQAIQFERPLNPHSGCFFLNADQMRHWVSRDDFGVARRDFIGPLESAASLSVMQSFKVYKPVVANANFLEIEHHGEQFLRKIRRAAVTPNPS